ncbi:unnamed protein product [Timema podura]|uniref:Uncharacterized protein n=1 Tax=Timema podura TaxID=61482 RepID=A0ABN7PST7_TIMPD|nr:unnamed protein product [Timema podura]
MYDHCYSHRLGEAKEGWKRNFQQQELSAVAYVRVLTPSPILPLQCDTPDQVPSPANVSRTLTKLCHEVGDID